MGGDGGAGGFGVALYRYRLSRGLSLRGLARQLGMSGHGGLGDYENGRRLPPEDVVLACERVLEVPDGELLTLWRAALAERAAARAAGRTEVEAVPGRVAQLPADLADFTGRREEIAALRRARRPVVAVICGKPGVGKTTLAIHIGHLLSREYPDTQLYHDLHGVHGAADPGELLAAALRALGMTDTQIPAGVDERAAAYRSLLHGRRALVVVDNAADEAQVRPLLPGGPDCLTLVTSRSRLSGLAGVHRLDLDVPDQDTAIELLAEISGRARVEAEPAEAAALVQACGRLPLAVRIAGNRLAAWPQWTVSHLAVRLADEQGRLGWLKAGDLEVRSAFAVSYQALDPAGRRLFRRLSLVPGASFGADLAAVLAGTTRVEAEHALEELAAASLVEPAPAPGRYRLHDLLRLYAGERRDAEEDGDEAAESLVDHLLTTARQASAAIAPPGQLDTRPDARFADDRVAALEWLDAERDNVRGAATMAADERVGDLLAYLIWYLDLRCAWRDLRELSELAQTVAPDLSSAAQAWNGLGLAFSGSGEYAEAVRCHERAAELARSAGDPVEEGRAVDKLGVALWGLGRFAEAAAHHERDVEICRGLGDRWGEAAGLSHWGYALRGQGRSAEAADRHRRAGELMSELGDVRGEAMTATALGRALADLGRYAEARDCDERALAVFEMVGDRWAVGTARHGLGVALHGLARPEPALVEIERALAIFTELGDRMWEAHALRERGTVLDTLGDPAAAREAWEGALVRYGELGSPAAGELRRLLDRTP